MCILVIQKLFSFFSLCLRFLPVRMMFKDGWWLISQLAVPEHERIFCRASVLKYTPI